LLTPAAPKSGSPVITVTPVGTDGTTYDVSVSGITGRGQVVATIAAGATHDALGNPSTASTSTDNRINYDFSGPVVTVSKASGQANPSSAATLHFTVTFDEAVTDFTTADVTLNGSAPGKLVATVTGSGTTYDVAVSGMNNNGTVGVTILAGAAHDWVGNASTASNNTGNSVSFVLANQPTFRLTAPTSGTFSAGQTVLIAWSGANVVPGTNISLCYDTDTAFNHNEHWIEVEAQPAANGYGTYTWNTTGVAPGTYHIAGYLYAGKAYYSSLPQTITILGPAPPTFRLTSPTSGTVTAGQTVTVAWSAGNVPTDGSANISLCYDQDMAINHNEHYIEVGQVTAANGYGSTTWNTTGVAPGKYYLAGYLWDNGKPTFSHLATTITIVAPPMPTFRVTAPVSGSYTAGQDVTVWWSVSGAQPGANISICYDKDTSINGNEHYVEVGQVTAANGYGSYTWNTLGVAPGKYYVGGYLWYNGKPVFSHLATPITITGAALTVDASTPPSGNAVPLTEAQLQPIVVEAERRLTAATGIQVAAALAGVSVRIDDLPGKMLGEAADNTIYISPTAAGYGWFVDSTPADDSEFADPLGSYALAAAKGSAAANRVDLLTTVMHEMAHELGYGHSDSLDLMYPALPLGERRFLDAADDASAVDQVFASVGNAGAAALRP
jgi:hypothetical protein